MALAYISLRQLGPWTRVVETGLKPKKHQTNQIAKMLTSYEDESAIKPFHGVSVKW